MRPQFGHYQLMGTEHQCPQFGEDNALSRLNKTARATCFPAAELVELGPKPGWGGGGGGGGVSGRSVRETPMQIQRGGKVLYGDYLATLGIPKARDSLTHTHTTCKPMLRSEADRSAHQTATERSISAQHLKE